MNANVSKISQLGYEQKAPSSMTVTIKIIQCQMLHNSDLKGYLLHCLHIQGKITVFQTICVKE